MILIDSRVGSKELHPYIIDSQLVTLEFGDAMFPGKGPKGSDWLIGIERKAIQDLLSCMVDGRFTGVQLPGLIKTYNATYLIVEGYYRFHNRSHELQLLLGNNYWKTVKHGNRTYSYKEVLGYLNSIQVMTGIYIVRTFDLQDTVTHIESLHHWWNSKEYEDHKAHLTQHKTAILGKAATPFRKFVTGIPGVGWGMSKDIAAAFNSPQEMCNADVDMWTSIKGVGKLRAANITKFLKTGNQEE